MHNTSVSVYGGSDTPIDRGLHTVSFTSTNINRMQVYLTTLESTKSWSLKTAAMARWAPNEAARAGMASSLAGAVASMVTQSVIVPIDVVSQRLMVAGAQHLPRRVSGQLPMQQRCAAPVEGLWPSGRASVRGRCSSIVHSIPAMGGVHSESMWPGVAHDCTVLGRPVLSGNHPK